MTTFASGRVDRSGNREHLAARFVGKIGGDERAAGELGFDDDSAKGHASDDAIADGEGLFVGWAIEGKLGDDRAVLDDLLEELGVFRREHEIDAGAKDSDGAALGVERALMRGRIDASCE